MPLAFSEIYRVVKLIPKGRVMSYSAVARQCGYPRAARQVGYAMYGLPAELGDRVPWWRVINAQGRISNAYGPEEQKRRLLLQKARARARALNDAMTAIQRKARLCESADYYTLLGVGPRASLEEVRAGYLRERSALSPSVLPYRSRAAMDRELRQISLVLDEAYAVLSDPVRRACYSLGEPRMEAVRTG